MPPAPFPHPLPGLSPAWQVVAAVALGAAGVYFLLPRPRHRRVAVGVFLTLAAAVVLGLFVATTFGGPSQNTIDDRVYAGLFWLFSSVAVAFAVVMVAQRNPGRGAMAFAVSVLATCGLFLLLAAPFLMAATVVVYAGATIVTFLFVLMLSHAGGPSDENDRSREPLLGSLGGLGFAGLMLFTLYLGSPARADGYPLPAAPVTVEEQQKLRSAAADLYTAANLSDPREVDLRGRIALATVGQVVGVEPTETAPVSTPVVGWGIQERLKVVAGFRGADAVAAADTLRTNKAAAVAALDTVRGDTVPDAVKAKLTTVADGATLLAGRGELPARNVAAVGYLLYSEHLLAVELAGTLLLVATVGAVAVAGRRAPA